MWNITARNGTQSFLVQKSTLNKNGHGLSFEINYNISGELNVQAVPGIIGEYLVITKEGWIIVESGSYCKFARIY